jgi:hypothetical protein
MFAGPAFRNHGGSPNLLTLASDEVGACGIYEVVTAATLQVTSLWDVATFRRICCFHCQDRKV